MYPLQDFKALYKYCIIIIKIVNLAESDEIWYDDGH